MKKITKKASAVLIGLILAVILLGILTIFIIKSSSIIRSTGKISEVQNWVDLKSNPLTKNTIASGYPPVNEINEPIKINSEKDFKSLSGKPPKVHKDIADGLLDCWNAFRQGDKDFIGTGDKFCFPCQKIEFKDSIRDIQITGLNNYLKTQKISPGRNSPTYLQVLYKHHPEILENQIDKTTDIISAKRDLYIFFISMKKSDWKDKIEMSEFRLFSPELISAVRQELDIFSDVAWNPAIELNNAETIEELCK